VSAFYFKPTSRLRPFYSITLVLEPMIDSRHIFHNYLLLCLNHSLSFKNNEVPGYSEAIKIYISKIDYERHGCWLQPRQTQMFNLHVDFYMKALLIAYTDTYLQQSINPQLNNALRFALEQMKISELDWDMDTITKYYYRHRSASGKPLLYKKKKIYYRNVRFEKQPDFNIMQYAL
jgi:hypothetical protein